jgi:hypothetical protein
LGAIELTVIANKKGFGRFKEKFKTNLREHLDFMLFPPPPNDLLIQGEARKAWPTNLDLN